MTMLRCAGKQVQLLMCHPDPDILPPLAQLVRLIVYRKCVSVLGIYSRFELLLSMCVLFFGKLVVCILFMGLLIHYLVVLSSDCW